MPSVSLLDTTRSTHIYPLQKTLKNDTNSEYTAAKIQADALKRLPSLKDVAQTVSGMKQRLEEHKDRNLYAVDTTLGDMKRAYPGLTLNQNAKTPWLSHETGKRLNDSDKVRLLVEMLPHENTPFQFPRIVHAVAELTPAIEKLLPSQALERTVQRAMDPSVTGKTGMTRLWHQVKQRYSQYFDGAKDGFANPRGQGNVLSNLGTTSVMISASLYGMLYLVEYIVVKQKLRQEDDKQSQQQQQRQLQATYASQQATQLPLMA